MKLKTGTKLQHKFIKEPANCYIASDRGPPKHEWSFNQFEVITPNGSSWMNEKEILEQFDVIKSAISHAEGEE